MTDWAAFSAADFDAKLAPRGAAKRAAETADQAGLFFVPTPVARPAKHRAEPDKHVAGDVALFGESEPEPEPAAVPVGAMCRCSAPATGPVICADGQQRYLCEDCRQAEIRACHERGPDAGLLGHPTCRKCGLSLRWRPEIHRDVTLTSNNPECYGR